MEEVEVRSYDDRSWYWVDNAFIVFFGGLLAYNILAWQRLFGFGPLWHPLQSTALAVCLFMQSLSRIVRRRSRALAWALLGTSLVPLGISVTLR
jgi:hypothetical protein